MDLSRGLGDVYKRQLQYNLSTTDHRKTKQRVGAEGLEPPTSSV
jgi:hypothetical protein